MVFNKKNAKNLFLVLVLVLFLSSTAVAATSVTEVQYVLYERSDGKMIIVDYQKALDQYDPPLKREPLKKALEDIALALYNFRNVYVQTEDKIIDYSKAVNDGKTFSQALAVSTYNVNIDLFALADSELYSATGSSWAYRTPLLPQFPAGITANVAWSVFARCWFVNIIIDPGEYDITEVNSVRVMGKTALRGSGNTYNYWRARIYESDLPAGASEPLINTTTVRIMYGGSWLW